MTAAGLDLDGIERRAQRAADERHCWANESGVVDRDVIAGLRRAKELAVDDVPALVREIRRQRAELDNANHQHQAVRNQVDALVREVRRLQHAEGRASRHAILRDKYVAEADAFVAARDAEIARFNAREAALRLELHDAKADAEDLRSRLKATSDACNDAENKLHTMTEVARGNKRHVAYLTALIERVNALTVGEDGKPKDPALALYVGDLNRALVAQLPHEQGSLSVEFAKGGPVDSTVDRDNPPPWTGGCVIAPGVFGTRGPITPTPEEKP